MKNLFEAIKKSDLGAITETLKAIPDINARFGMDTPLACAARTGDMDAIQMLLDAGADPRARNLKGKLPADLAMAKGHAAAWELLDARAQVLVQQDHAPGRLALAPQVLMDIRRIVEVPVTGNFKPWALNIQQVAGDSPAIRQLLDEGQFGRLDPNLVKQVWPGPASSTVEFAQQTYDAMTGRMDRIPLIRRGELANNILRLEVPVANREHRDAILKLCPWEQTRQLNEEDLDRWLTLAGTLDRSLAITDAKVDPSLSSENYLLTITSPKYGELPKSMLAPLALLASGHPVLLERARAIIDLEKVVAYSLLETPEVIDHMDTLLSLGARMPDPDELLKVLARIALWPGRFYTSTDRSETMERLIRWLTVNGADVNAQVTLGPLADIARNAGDSCTCLKIALDALDTHRNLHYFQIAPLVKVLLQCGAQFPPQLDLVATMVQARLQPSMLIGTLQAIPGGLDTIDRKGHTSLMLAAKQGNIELLTELLIAGANPHLENNGRNALSYLASSPAKTQAAADIKARCAKVLSAAMRAYVDKPHAPCLKPGEF